MKIDFVLLVNASVFWVRYSCKHRAMKARCCLSLIFPTPFIFPHPLVLFTANFAYAQHLSLNILLSSSGCLVIFNTGFLIRFLLEVRLKSKGRRFKWHITY